MDPIRLLDLGLVPPMRSQTIYHAVAYALDPGSPDTIILVGSTKPYVSIGVHQELEKEVDVEYCRGRGLPIIRREVGGGAVYLDSDQVFAQWVFHGVALPRDIAGRFTRYVEPLVATYRALGIPAEYRPINDVHVEGRKIGGTGAARMGMAEVVVGSLMFDFDFASMARVLKVSSEKMRDKVFQSLDQYMTTMTRYLGSRPDRDAVVQIYLEQVQATLGRPIEPGEPSTRELELAEELDARFATDEWLYQAGDSSRTGVKIHQDVHVVEAATKTPGGLVRVTACLRDGCIDELTLSGDFTMLPWTATSALEDALRGTALEADAVRMQVEDVYRRLGIEAPGLTAGDLADAVLRLAQPGVGG